MTTLVVEVEDVDVVVVVVPVYRTKYKNPVSIFAKVIKHEFIQMYYSK